MSTDLQNIGDPKVIQDGTALAVLSWASMLLGLPIFLLPLITNDNAFATYHARQALVTYVVQIVLVVVFFMIVSITCGFGLVLFPIALLALIPTIDGLIKAMQGRAEPAMLVGSITASLFSSTATASSAPPSPGGPTSSAPAAPSTAQPESAEAPADSAPERDPPA